jgi:hypothetical protein
MTKIDLSKFSVKKGCVVSSLPFTPEQKEIFDAVVAEEDTDEYPSAQIFRVVKNDWGINLTKTSLQSHRNRDCICYQIKENK